MELIKKYYKKIVVYGLFASSLLLTITALIIRPQQISTIELYRYDTTPKLTEINFPYLLKIPLSSKTDFIEIHFGDDSINKHNYTISVFKDSDLIFSHEYENETSNIIRLPIGSTDFQNGDFANIQISCAKNCEDVKFKLYEIDNKFTPKVLISTHKLNLYYFWFAWLLFAISLILLPLAQEGKK